MPTDLKQSIERALVRNAEIDARNITVEVEGSKVILRGTVRSYAEKKAAEEAAWAAPGVTEMENRIVVSPPPVILANEALNVGATASVALLASYPARSFYPAIGSHFTLPRSRFNSNRLGWCSAHST
jgi:hypothetical protein